MLPDIMSQSVQSRATQEGAYGLSFLTWMAGAGDIVSAWWSKQRDVDLDWFWRSSDHLAGAIYALQARLTAIPIRVEARDPSVRSHVAQAEEYTARLLEASEFGEGWTALFGKWLVDRWTQDNGSFLEVIGKGDPAGPIQGPALGIAHLDSAKCTRTGSFEYPVVYSDPDGKQYKLHRTRVIASAEMPSTRAEMNGVGTCAVSRCLNSAQSLVDDIRYKMEKMGSRPLRSIIWGKRVPQGTFKAALEIANQGADNRGQARYALIPAIEGLPADSEIGMLDLSSLPDGFEYETDVTLTLYCIALAFGVPPRWLWPATTTGATKADAMYQHIAGLSQGPAQTLSAIQYMLGGDPDTARSVAARFLPPHLKLVFDYQDDEQDRAAAEISQLRADRRTKDLGSSITNERVEREKMLAAGELTKSQFADLELADGRLDDGTDVLSLFYDPDYADLLDLGVENPLDTAVNDAGEMEDAIGEAQRNMLEILGTEMAPAKRERCRTAQYALDALADLYKKPAAPPPPPTDQPDEMPMPGEMPMEEPGEDEGEEPMEATGQLTDEQPPPLGEMSKEMLEKFNAGQSVDDIQIEYRGKLLDAMLEYLASNSPITRFRNSFRVAVNDAFTFAFNGGYVEGGGSVDEMDEADRNWIINRIEAEVGFSDILFQQLKELRGEEGAEDAARTHAEGYTRSVYSVFSEGKLRGSKNVMLTFDGQDGAENCPTCAQYKGKRHSAKWWTSRGLVPAPGNSNFVCGGYNCQHYLVDDDGSQWAGGGGW